MRATLRLLTARLAPFAPTGITGVLTHPHPRPTLIALYNYTLQQLRTLPQSSVYRASVENLTKHRLDIVTAAKPPGYEAYLSARRADVGEGAQTAKQGEEFYSLEHVAVYMRAYLTRLFEFAPTEREREYIRTELAHWSAVAAPAPTEQALPESVTAGPPPSSVVRSPGRTEAHASEGGGEAAPDRHAAVSEEYRLAEEQMRHEGIVLEPQLSAEQVEEIEEKIGDGLIEEVVEQGWAELRALRAVRESAAWEPLEVVPEEGQWKAFERTPEGQTSA